MAKSFKEYLGLPTVRVGGLDSMQPMASLGDTPPKGQGGRDTRAVGLTASKKLKVKTPAINPDFRSDNEKNVKEELEEGVGLDMIKALLPKTILHALKRAIHAKNYKVALDKYHELTREIRKDPEKFKRKVGQKDGVMIGNVDNIAKGIAADYAGIKYREFLKILDRKTRYAEYRPEQKDTPLYNYLVDNGVVNNKE